MCIFRAFGQKDFTKNSALSRRTSYAVLAPCQNLEEKTWADPIL